jgi:hypothetical protein
MQARPVTAPAAILALSLLAAAPAQAVTVEKLDLGQIVEQAGSIVIVTVLDARPSSVPVGSAELPVTLYSVHVEEALAGALPLAEDGTASILRFLRNPGTVERDGLLHRSNLPELPRLRVGGRYLLLTTTPSLVGLSAPVGLEQGVFRLTGKPGAETAVNGLGNGGLFTGIESIAPVGWDSGPIRSDVLTSLIRVLVAR